MVGRDGELVSAPAHGQPGDLLRRHDGAAAGGQPSRPAPSGVLALFDHEEVGSVSDRGAASPLLETVLERIVLAAGGDREDLHRALAGSVVASGDMAHATHPNYVDKHEPQHQIAVNGGPVLKVHPTCATPPTRPAAAAFALACEQAGVPLQRYEHRADLPCGSTVGPITAGGLGVTTVDVGAPQLAMHSARELCGAQDPGCTSPRWPRSCPRRADHRAPPAAAAAPSAPTVPRSQPSGRRQRDLERRRARPAGEVDPAAVGLGDRLHDAQPQPGAARGPGA